jgi:DNA processing protein
LQSATTVVGNNPSAKTTPDEEAVLAALGHDPQLLDTLLLRSGLALEQALAALHGLQHSEQVAQTPGGFYQRVKA